ncbi:hypothetical protein M434DRAFT_69283 [Hypoxylon sp. CO27-5]|nr:hypothetical protein M434DRAFT_69283 [Hypoxylon sp. CO27-5]
MPPPAAEIDSGRYNISNKASISRSELACPFAEGGFRLVVRGTYTEGLRKGQACVAKWFKTGRVFEKHYFTLDIKAVDKALEIVNRFNQLKIVNRPIKINVPNVWAFDNNAGEWAGQHVLVEPFIHNYQKFNSNTGYVHNTSDLGEVMQAISHFSYHISRGQFVLCDLQGGVYPHDIVLSDPAILSPNREFGVTDLGPDGILSFFSQHRCNSYCRPNWAKPRDTAPIFPAVAGTSMMEY